jgi:hypothetical protein
MVLARFAAPALAALLAPLAAQADETPSPKHLLRYRFAKGAEGHYLMAQDADVKMKAGDRDIDTAMSMSMYLHLRVADVANGVAALESKLTRVKMKMDNPMTGKIEFDTDDEESVPPMFDAFLDMVGQTIEVSMDERGQPKGVEIPEVMRKAASAGIDFEQMLSSFLPVLPEEPLAIGGTWTTKTSQAFGGQGGAIAMTVDNELLAVEGDQITIAQKMQIAVDDQALPGKIDVEKSEGKLVLDLGKGLPKGGAMSNAMRMAVDQGGMSMDVKMAMEMTIEAVAAPAAKTDKKEGEGKD